MNSQPPRSGPPTPIRTPCVLVCFIDPASGLCLGCWRDIDEVAGWASFSHERRAAIMAELPRRAARREDLDRIG